MTQSNSPVTDDGPPPDSSRRTSSEIEFSTRKRPLPENQKWFMTHWRPAAAWLYLVINFFDFVIAPILMMVTPRYTGGSYIPWQPLTLVGGGMFHLSFGAIIGVTAWGRTRERVSGVIE